jgi:hypothetical protein
VNDRHFNDHVVVSAVVYDDLVLATNVTVIWVDDCAAGPSAITVLVWTSDTINADTLVLDSFARNLAFTV